MAHHPFGGAPEQNLFQAVMAVLGDDDEIGTEAQSAGRDLFKGLSLPHQHLDESGIRKFRQRPGYWYRQCRLG